MDNFGKEIEGMRGGVFREDGIVWREEDGERRGIRMEGRSI